MKTSMLRAFSLLALASAALSAHADLLGATIHGTYLFPNASTTLFEFGDAIVGAGAEYVNPGGFPYSLDFTGTTLTLTASDLRLFLDSAFNGVVIDVASGPAFTGVTFTGGDDQPDAYVSDGKLNLDFSGIEVDRGDTASFSFTTAPVSSAVPGPRRHALRPDGVEATSEGLTRDVPLDLPFGGERRR